MTTVSKTAPVVNQEAIDALMKSHETSYLDKVKNHFNWNTPEATRLGNAIVRVAQVFLGPLQEIYRAWNAGSFEKMAKDVVKLTGEAAALKTIDVVYKNIDTKLEAATQSLVGRVKLVSANKNPADIRELLTATQDVICKQGNGDDDFSALAAARLVLQSYSSERINSTFPGFDFAGSFAQALDSQADLLTQMGLFDDKEAAKTAVRTSWAKNIQNLDSNTFEEVKKNVLGGVESQVTDRIVETEHKFRQLVGQTLPELNSALLKGNKDEKELAAIDAEFKAAFAECDALRQNFQDVSQEYMIDFSKALPEKLTPVDGAFAKEPQDVATSNVKFLEELRVPTWETEANTRIRELNTRIRELKNQQAMNAKSLTEAATYIEDSINRLAMNVKFSEELRIPSPVAPHEQDYKAPAYGAQLPPPSWETAATTYIRHLENQLAMTQGALRVADQQVARFARRQENLYGAYSEKHDALEEANRTISHYKRAQDVAYNRITDLEEANLAQRNDLMAAHRANDVAQQTIAAFREGKSCNIDEIARLKRILHLNNSTQDSLMADIGRLAVELESREEELNAMQQEKQKLVEVLNRMNVALEQALQQKAVLTGQLQDVDAQMNAIKVRLQAGMTAQGQASLRQANLIDGLYQENETLHQRNDELAGSLRLIQQAHDTLAAERKALVQHLGELDTQVGSLQAELSHNLAIQEKMVQQFRNISEEQLLSQGLAENQIAASTLERAQLQDAIIALNQENNTLREFLAEQDRFNEQYQGLLETHVAFVVNEHAGDLEQMSQMSRYISELAAKNEELTRLLWTNPENVQDIDRRILEARQGAERADQAAEQAFRNLMDENKDLLPEVQLQHLCAENQRLRAESQRRWPSFWDDMGSFGKEPARGIPSYQTQASSSFSESGASFNPSELARSSKNSAQSESSFDPERSFANSSINPEDSQFSSNRGSSIFNPEARAGFSRTGSFDPEESLAKSSIRSGKSFDPEDPTAGGNLSPMTTVTYVESDPSRLNSARSIEGFEDFVKKGVQSAQGFVQSAQDALLGFVQAAGCGPADRDSVSTIAGDDPIGLRSPPVSDKPSVVPGFGEWMEF